MLYRRQQQRKALLAAWRRDAENPVNDAKLTRDLLDDAARAPIEAAQLQTLRQQTDTSADAVGRLAATAPDEAGREHAQAVEQGLRDYVVAIETEQMLTQDPTQVAGDALVRASEARRTHARALDDALSRLDAYVHPQPPG